MLLGIWGNDERYIRTYWKRFSKPEEGVWIYYPADYAMKDEDGYFWIFGRADEVLNVSGHRIGTAEIEHALVLHPAVAEAAVIGRPDEIKGEVPVAFVILKASYAPTDRLKKELIDYVREVLGPIAAPAEVFFVNKLPKTRSGKIMRRVLKALATGKGLGDLSTLEDEASVEEVKNTLEASRCTDFSGLFFVYIKEVRKARRTYRISGMFPRRTPCTVRLGARCAGLSKVRAVRWHRQAPQHGTAETSLL